MSSYTKHYSVLFRECLEFLIPEKLTEKRTIADLTFGGGGHSFGLLEKDPLCYIFATDQDPDALKNGALRIKDEKLEHRINLVDTNFELFPQIYKERCGDVGVDGILMDLGVSSHHFDSPERGFSFRFDGPLDMRMDVDNNDQITAFEIINTYTEQELSDIFFFLGEERL